MAELKVGDSVLYKGGKKEIRGKISKIEKNKQNEVTKYLVQCNDGVLVECTAKELDLGK
jgi:preprotein translocase subunit YajC